MSYICLLANDNGAVCASDSRETSVRSHRYKDRRQKTFIAAANDAIWCCCGTTRIGRIVYSSDCMRKASRILSDASLPFPKRVERAAAFLERETRPVFYNKKTVFCFTLLYAFREADGPLQVGTFTVRGGKTTDMRTLSQPVMLEAGKNAALLTPRRRYLPKEDESLAALTRKAAIRVKEAIRYDRKAKSADPSYIPTVGGKVQLKSLEAR